jgi:hypothetical protein
MSTPNFVKFRPAVFEMKQANRHALCREHRANKARRSTQSVEELLLAQKCPTAKASRLMRAYSLITRFFNDALSDF